MWRMAGWVVGMVCLMASGISRAEVVYEVSATGATGTTTPWNSNFLGQSFNTGNNGKISSVVLGIKSAQVAGNFTLALYAATGSANNYVKTGSALFSKTATSTSTRGVTVDLSADNWLVSQNTIYILGVEAQATPAVEWLANTSASQTSSTGYITGFANMNRSDNTTVSTGDLVMTVNAVPEPGTLLLGGIAAACGGGGVWWKRRRRQPAEESQTAGEIAG